MFKQPMDGKYTFVGLGSVPEMRSSEEVSSTDRGSGGTGSMLMS